MYEVLLMLIWVVLHHLTICLSDSWVGGRRRELVMFVVALTSLLFSIVQMKISTSALILPTDLGSLRHPHHWENGLRLTSSLYLLNSAGLQQVSLDNKLMVSRLLQVSVLNFISNKNFRGLAHYLLQPFSSWHYISFTRLFHLPLLTVANNVQPRWDHVLQYFKDGKSAPGPHPDRSCCQK